VRVRAGAHAGVAADTAGLVDDHGLPSSDERIVDQKIDQPCFIGAVTQLRPRRLTGDAGLDAGGRIDRGDILV